MGCVGCSCSTDKGSAGGCKSNGGCSTGGCNRHNTYDWITAMGIRDPQPFEVVEVSFKNGSRKEFFKNPPHTRTTTGDWVLVESVSGGYDLGTVTLSGELVRLQMKRKRVKSDAKLQSVIRKAHERDLERLDEVRKQERDVMIKARAIARTLDLNMKVGDVEFQGDGRKCTFYYTADGRVDFRELIRLYAKDFKVKIEMRQIGARQESARLGGIGNCGRELCCSTWLTEFKSVNTAAARYQNLAINQTKLSGMCGRLKCCLNYELDTYIDALEDFPSRAEKFKTTAGLVVLMKTDVFKRLMFYAYAENRGKFYPLHVDQVWEALDMIKRGELPSSLDDLQALSASQAQGDEPEEEELDYENVDNVLELPIEKRKKKKKKKKKGRADESVAAAVEKADRDQSGNQPRRDPSRDDKRSGGDRKPQQPRRPQGETRPATRDDKPKGNEQRTGEPRPPRNEQRTGEPRPPRNEQRTGEPRPPRNEQRTGEPRPPRNEQRTGEPRPPREQRPPATDQQTPNAEPQTPNDQRNRNRNQPGQRQLRTEPRQPKNDVSGDVQTPNSEPKPPNNDHQAPNSEIPSNNDKNRNRDRRRFKGRGPKKD